MAEPTEDWESVLEVYAGKAHDALVLATLLEIVRRKMGRGPKDRREASAELEFAIKTLYQYTDFNKVSRKLYRLWITEKLSTKQENKLRELGVKF